MTTNVGHSPGVMRADGPRVIDDAHNLIALAGSDADAERIAESWNSHDELVEALQDCVKLIEDHCEGEGGSGHLGPRDIYTELSVAKIILLKAGVGGESCGDARGEA